MTNPPTLSFLAAQIWSHATILDACLSREGQPRPSFDVNTPSSWPAEKDTKTSQAARHAPLKLTLSLHDLVLGPTEMIVRDAVVPKWTSTALRLIANYRVARVVPEQGGDTRRGGGKDKAGGGDIEAFVEVCGDNWVFSGV